MPDEQPTPSVAERYDAIERDILYAITDPEDCQPLWSVEDLAREMDCPTVIDHINSLQRAGLVNRTSDGHVFATRAAVRHIQIVGRVS